MFANPRMTRLGGLKGPSDCVGIVKGDPIYYRGPTKKKYLGSGLYMKFHGRPNVLSLTHKEK